MIEKFRRWLSKLIKIIKTKKLVNHGCRCCSNYRVRKDALKSIKQVSRTTKTGKVKVATIFMCGFQNIYSSRNAKRHSLGNVFNDFKLPIDKNRSCRT